ncbi:MAG: CU044_2847 family protein [Anaerolineae bacterium]
MTCPFSQESIITDSTRVFFNDSPIQVEIALATPQSGLQENSRGGAADKVKQIGDDVLFHAFHTIYKIARKTEKLITDLPNAAPDADHPLTGAEIEFGIKFDSGSNATVVTSSVGATVTVKLTWGRK